MHSYSLYKLQVIVKFLTCIKWVTYICHIYDLTYICHIYDLTNSCHTYDLGHSFNLLLYFKIIYLFLDVLYNIYYYASTKSFTAFRCKSIRHLINVTLIRSMRSKSDTIVHRLHIDWGTLIFCKG